MAQAECEVKIVESSTDSDSVGHQICIKVRAGWSGTTSWDGVVLAPALITMTMPVPLQAEEYNAALVVMAAHNKGRLLKYLLGSATKYCVNHCRSTVLVHHL